MKRQRTKNAFGKHAEVLVLQLMRHFYKIPRVRRAGYRAPYDFIANGHRCELKVSNPQKIRVGKFTYTGWRFNIHRHGVLKERGVNYYILRLEGVPEFYKAIHLVIKAPLRKKTVLITLRSLITLWGQHFNRFNLLKEREGSF